MTVTSQMNMPKEPEHFDVKNMRDYHNLYLETDVLLLAGIFANFRDICFKNYELDPAWYYTAPGLAWDACLKKTGVQLELLSDPDMLLMIVKGVRGRVSMISTQYAEANHKYMGPKYHPDKESKFIQYLDAKNLCGWAMSKTLPVRDFKWMSESEIKNWVNIPCILEVDLEYLQERHDVHNRYCLAPERLVSKVEKFIPNSRDKTKYVIHHKNLKQYLRLGLKIKKIHRGISFHEEDWIKPYIDLNTQLRTKASNDFEKDFFKIMNISVFGKTMENIRNRINVSLIKTKSLQKSWL